MSRFDKAHQAVHLPDDRRMAFVLQRKYAASLAAIVAVPVAIAWLQVFAFGIHPAPVDGITTIAAGHTGRGFPLWIRWTHFANALFFFLLVRSGLSILMEHPRLYWDNHCTPGTEWLRLTPVIVPPDRLWTSKDDARYISPLVALPGYRHTIGMGRAWHFITDYGFLISGLIYVVMLFASGGWPRIVPTSWSIIPYAWQTFVQYATLHMPVEANGYYAYNALQQLAYFTVVFIMAPISILTGIAMSPAIDNAFPWYPRIFGGVREPARFISYCSADTSSSRSCMSASLS